ncbi:RNA polymerase sigma factor [Chitinophaga eiseniae]|uniref:Sigma-70 family RNA polymerase sigma factor n=1 Tax=Chitinophaga eiseniae TaxID=634771 RepID=A0A847SCK8_9BACT|nr:sigma-70 family RNA polymerase sigma factor [Chitinophaga eiseniae]NLR80940.1 sigma-70 family RNA polymerase sigma factor [Chitinophaga eiseniae]
MQPVSELNGAEWNQQTFKVLYDEYYVLVSRYCYAFTGDYELARDIAAELFCDLWRQRANIRVNANIKNYLLVAARRRCKKHKDKLPITVTIANDQLEEGISHHTPDTHMVHKESKAALQQLLLRLDPVKKEIIDLKLLGLTNKEIAHLLHVTPKKVEYQLNTAIRVLQDEIKTMQLTAQDCEIGLMIGSLLLLIPS